MNHILIADDERRIGDLIEKYALHDGYRVTKVENGKEAVAFCRTEEVDLVILDVMMPVMDGFSACREIRSFSTVPIIMLSARGEEYDRIHGFEIGVDDYVVKPFSPRELMLRVDAVLKRMRAKGESADVFAAEGLVVNFTAHVVEVDGKRIDLSPKERDLLFYLVRNRNIALTRETLITHVWGYDFYGDDRTLDTHIKLLRKQLGNYHEWIVTVRGVGYRFEAN